MARLGLGPLFRDATGRRLSCRPAENREDAEHVVIVRLISYGKKSGAYLDSLIVRQGELHGLLRRPGVPADRPKSALAVSGKKAFDLSFLQNVL